MDRTRCATDLACCSYANYYQYSPGKYSCIVDTCVGRSSSYTYIAVSCVIGAVLTLVTIVLASVAISRLQQLRAAIVSTPLVSQLGGCCECNGSASYVLSTTQYASHRYPAGSPYPQYATGAPYAPQYPGMPLTVGQWTPQMQLGPVTSPPYWQPQFSRPQVPPPPGTVHTIAIAPAHPSISAAGSADKADASARVLLPPTQVRSSTAAAGQAATSNPVAQPLPGYG